MGGGPVLLSGWEMCKATLDFVEHQQSTRLALLLQCRLAQRLQHVVDTRGIPKPVEDEACRLWTASILAMFFLRVWVPDRRSILQQWADEDFISFFLNVGGTNL